MTVPWKESRNSRILLPGYCLAPETKGGGTGTNGLLSIPRRRHGDSHTQGAGQWYGSSCSLYLNWRKLNFDIVIHIVTLNFFVFLLLVLVNKELYYLERVE